MKIDRVSDGEIFSPNGEVTGEGIVFRVLSCVAELRDISMTDLPPLAETVDPDALETLFPSAEYGPCSVTLEFANTHVIICQNGDIRAFLLPDRV